MSPSLLTQTGRFHSGSLPPRQATSAKRTGGPGLSGRALLLGAVLLLVHSPLAHAMNLTGVLLQALDADGNPSGPVWHTSSDPGARPLGFTRAPPRLARTFPLANLEGELDRWVTPEAHIATLFWQYHVGEFPPAMVLNLYFNGDSLTPGISAIVAGGQGFTNARANSAPTTLSLYLRDVDNPGTLAFDNSSERAQLGAAFYMPTAGLNDNSWQPTDFIKIDRVGLADLLPDGWPDGVLVFELTVGPSALRPTAPPASPRAGVPTPAPVMVGPLSVSVGDDQWEAVPTPTLDTEPPPAPDTGEAWPPETPPVADTQTPLTPTPAATEPASTPAASGHADTTLTAGPSGTGTPAAATPAAATQAPARAVTARTPAGMKPTPGRR